MGKSFNFKLSRSNILFKCYEQFSNYNSTNNFKWYTTFINLQRSYKAIESVHVAAANSILLTGNQSATGRKTLNSDNTVGV
jgi:uncharacterized protein (DUF4213/DUF364 family)